MRHRLDKATPNFQEIRKIYESQKTMIDVCSTKAIFTRECLKVTGKTAHLLPLKITFLLSNPEVAVTALVVLLPSETES